MRKKRTTKKAIELQLTDQMVGFRHVVYVNGCQSFVTDSCIFMLKTLVRAMLDGGNNGFVRDVDLNAEPSNVARYVYRWEKDIGAFDKRLEGVQIFETDRQGNWRIVIPRKGLK